jgi:hypothetical protein
MPLPGQPDPGSSGGSPLGDLLGGIDRPKLDAFVSTANARNGLVSAQTQEAMVKASQMQEQQKAWDDLESNLISQGAKASDASLIRSAMVGSNDKNPETAMKVWGQAQLAFGNQDAQVRGQQAFKGDMATPPAVSGNSLGVPGTPGALGGAAYAGAPLMQTPETIAKTGESNALASLNTHKDLSPADFRAQTYGATSPEGITALQTAVHEGRIDYTRINSRTAPVLAQMAMGDPHFNFNAGHAAAALQSNAAFQQRAMGLEIMPGMLSNLTNLGKAIGYNDVNTVGKMQQFMKGELNDPAYTEYMTNRNDVMMRLAYLMRGVNMSDKAVEMESEVERPTLAPYALDAWLKGQMAVIKPMIDINNKARLLGEPGHANPLGPDVAAPAPVPHYSNEAAARAAGHQSGERVFLEDQGGAGKLD